MTHIGFTGTRYGMAPNQRLAVVLQVEALVDESMVVRAHHGDCIGADAEFHDVCREYPFSYIIGHPGPLDDVARQAGKVCDERREPKLHMRRNADIVRESQFMIAAPFEDREQPRGGTWRTIAMARKAGRPLAIVWRNGDVIRERWTL